MSEGSQVCGVEVTGEDGRKNVYKAANTIVCAGALRSPILLMRSGIGSAAELVAKGIQPVKDLPGVGKNLQNHWMLLILAILDRSAIEGRGERPIGLSYLRWSTGLPGAPLVDMNMYVRSYLTWNALAGRLATMIPILMRPFSRGQVNLGDTAESPPCIEFGLRDPRDIQRLTAGARLAIELFAEQEIQDITMTPQIARNIGTLMRFNRPSIKNAFLTRAAATLLSISPRIGRFAMSQICGLSSAQALLDDEMAMADFIHNNIFGASHVCGTCRIGDAADRHAVVDFDCRVHGVAGLMVVDTSVMPTIPSANTHIPTIMVAEKIAAGLCA
jgi:5-(hydroxymethyl)furfural/furfural oxidase